MYCTYCGHQIKTKSKYCSNCGKEVHKNTEKFTADIKTVITQVKEVHKPATGKSLRDHTAFLHWLILSVVFFLFAFSGITGESTPVGYVLGLLSGAYAYYIYQGGSYVVVNRYVELFVRLFTEGYNKKLPEGHPASKAWIVWAILAAALLFNTLMDKMPNRIFGIATMVPAGMYAGYLFNGGKFVYVPIIIMLSVFGLVVNIFS